MRAWAKVFQKNCFVIISASQVFFILIALKLPAAPFITAPWKVCVKMKLLLVEDNQILADDLSDFLKENGFLVEHAADLQSASERVSLYEYDLVILDIGLPDGNGLVLISEMKQDDNEACILIVTAKNAVEEKVKGLELGADDYITKPFHKSELNARIRSILRRSRQNGNDILTAGNIRMDTAACQVSINDYMLKLTRKEYDLLLFLSTTRTVC